MDYAFYDPRENLHPKPLTHNPFNALVAPRPIGWISSISLSGEVNLAPFSYFNGISSDPPMVMFAPNAKDREGTPKDTLRNIQEVPEFVVNVVSEELAAAMNQTSAALPFGISEMEAAGLPAADSINVSPPRVAAARASLECRVYRTIELPTGLQGRQSHVVLGEVVGVHIDDALIAGGMVDQLALRQVARLGYSHYLSVENIFDMQRPSITAETA